ncbi:MAG: hypothetical protein P8Y61_00610 [Gammaproteobacteria bacterium]|jgi:hypothetical protein
MNTNNTYKMFFLTGVVLAAALTAGCASGPTRVEADYGNSVRAMRQAQTLDPVAAAAPDTTPVMTTDGQRMENALKSYRENVGRPAAVSDTIDFEVGR